MGGTKNSEQNCYGTILVEVAKFCLEFLGYRVSNEGNSGDRGPQVGQPGAGSERSIHFFFV